MTTFLWILLGGVVMSGIALVGSVTLLLKEETLQKLLLPLVAFAAGSLLGGAFFHMLPGAVEEAGFRISLFAWLLLGFSIFLVLEQFLHWHHCHRASAQCRKPLTYLILIGDGLHNFMGGLAVAGTFLVDIRQCLLRPDLLGGVTRGLRGFLRGRRHVPASLRRGKLPVHCRIGSGSRGEQRTSILPRGPGAPLRVVAGVRVKADHWTFSIRPSPGSRSGRARGQRSFRSFPTRP